MSVLMELSKIVISDTRKEQIIVLKEVHGERHFPILIGEKEAEAIDRRLKGIVPQRPLTHDLLASVIERLGGKLERIEITHVQDGCFFGRLFIRQDGQLLEADSRPSDAIALGIASLTPIYVSAQVLDQVCG